MGHVQSDLSVRRATVSPPPLRLTQLGGAMCARRLGLMKEGAILVNTARGAVIDEAALVDALDGGRLHAAGLDVFEREPEIHPGLIDHERAVLLPHIGSATEETRVALTEIAVRNLLCALNGDEPPNRVD